MRVAPNHAWFWDSGTNFKTEENSHDAVHRNFAFGKRPIG